MPVGVAHNPPKPIDTYFNFYASEVHQNPETSLVLLAHWGKTGPEVAKTLERLASPPIIVRRIEDMVDRIDAVSSEKVVLIIGYYPWSDSQGTLGKAIERMEKRTGLKSSGSHTPWWRK